MRIGYLECFAGISGDMLLGALVGAGVDRTLLAETARSLGLGAELRFESADRSGIQAIKALVMVGEREADASPPAGAHTHEGGSTHEHTHKPGHIHPHAHEHGPDHAGPAHTHADHHDHVHGRTLPQIRELIARAPLEHRARRLALATFELLGAAEAKVHGMPIEAVHFHEVGAVDAIVDIVCAAVGLTALGVEQWYSSAINVGAGSVECAHGRFPVPAPATAALLLGMPTYSEGPAMELVTPTGAALLRALDAVFADGPGAVRRIDAIGYGAGTRNPPRFPNVLRLSVGEEAMKTARGWNASTGTGVAGEDRHEAGARETDGAVKKDTVTVLECAVDDASAEVVAHAAEQLLRAGALDVMRSPVTMKKGRLGTLMTVLCRPEDASTMERLLFAETSTLGVRVRREGRAVLRREQRELMTEFGPVRLKVGLVADAIVNVAPEYEDCRARAAEHGVSLKTVMDAAVSAGWQALGGERSLVRVGDAVAG